MTDGENVTNHIHEYNLLLEELATIGLIYNEEDHIETLLASLLKSYESIIQALSNTLMTVQDVISKIMHEDL